MAPDVDHCRDETRGTGGSGPGRSLGVARRWLIGIGLPDTLGRLGSGYLPGRRYRHDVLAVLYGTDKSSRNHGYSQHYETHLGPLRYRRMTLLEIGVGGDADPAAGGESLACGGTSSLAQIHGADLFRKVLPRLGSRVKLHQCDQSDPGELASLTGRMSRPLVIVDDGSHVGDHVWTSFRALFPFLLPGGWYVIEDLHTSFFESYGGSPAPGVSTPIGLAQQATLWSQRSDPSFGTHFHWTPDFETNDVAEVHCYPGIVFIRKS